jgi:oxygen-independent coproporphyrinogen-3 oxidase
MGCKENQGEVSACPCGALYVHVPFCRGKCRYCGFYSVRLKASLARRYVRAAERELSSYAGRLSRPLASVFLGGGTPTCLGAELLGGLLEVLAPWLDERTEFSVEANPGTVDPTMARLLAAGGVNRVNLGAQSFEDKELRFLGRGHVAAEARRAVQSLRAAGVRNLGLDLIYGIPGQTLGTWRSSLAEALALRPEHLSCYALSIEKDTPLEADLRAGRIEEADEALQAACYRHAIAAAREAGLQHYEISNFAREGRRCRHHLTYWRNQPYLGIGPAAASYLDGRRRTNAADLDAYLQALEAGGLPPASQERLTGRAGMAETVMLALRLTEGLERQAFRARYGCDVVDAFPFSISRYEALGALQVTDADVRIAGDWLFVSDTILADILSEA